MNNFSINPTSLRERKKAKTRVLLQDCALRLFQEQGYGATTIAQIAKAVDISLRTFYRYFPNKEDVILYDALDLSIAETIKAMSTDIGTLQAIRTAMISVYGTLSNEQHALAQVRHEIIIKTPDLCMRHIAKLAGGIQFIAAVIADRMSLPSDHLAVRTTAGAIFGVSISALTSVIETQEWSLDVYLQRIVDGLTQLEDGLTL
jgi:AcrR family transcriptional regulator